MLVWHKNFIGKKLVPEIPNMARFFIFMVSSVDCKEFRQIDVIRGFDWAPMLV
jgi:hypothetical protein